MKEARIRLLTDDSNLIFCNSGRGIARKREDDDDDDDNVKAEDTLASRFYVRFCEFLLDGFRAKDRNVRFRVVQTCSAVVSHLGEIE